MDNKNINISLWHTKTGKAWLCQMKDELEKRLDENTPCRFLIVTGGMDIGFFKSHIESKFKSNGYTNYTLNISEFSTPVELFDNIDRDADKEFHIILLNCLLSNNTRAVGGNLNLEALKYDYEQVEDFCNNNNYEFCFFPYCLTNQDFTMLHGQVFSLKGINPWLADIAHHMAISISQGVLLCYLQIIQIFFAKCEGNNESLPSPNDCLDEYIRSKGDGHAYIIRSFQSFWEKLSHSNKAKLNKLLNNPYSVSVEDDVYWKVLWSLNLAGKRDKKWELDPAMNTFLIYQRRNTLRCMAANLINLPPIYLAWVLYCGKIIKDSSSSPFELDKDYPLYPKEADNASDYLVLDDREKKLASKCRELRNWLQHEKENREKDESLSDKKAEKNRKIIPMKEASYYYRICWEIMNYITRDGYKRNK